MERLDYKKIFYHVEKLLELKNTGDTWPVHMQIGLTNRCNHRCIFCFGGHAGNTERRYDEINLDALLNALQQARKHGLKAVTLVGLGEPLLYSKIDMLLRSLRELDIKVGIFTNGVLLNERRREFVNEYATFVRFSVNGSNSQEHEIIHQKKGDFPVVVENIKKLVAMRRHGRTHLPTIGVQMVFCQQNYRSMVEATKMWKEIGVDYFELKPLVMPEYATQIKLDPVKNKEEIRLLMQEAETFQSETFSVYAKYNMYEDTMDKFEKGVVRTYKKCFGQSVASVIHEDGSVKVCNGLYGHPVSIGNIYESSFEDIWTSKKRKDVMAQINIKKCSSVCRFHLLNEILWDFMYPKEENHPDFV